MKSSSEQQKTTLVKGLKAFDLSEEEASIYLLLLRKGPLTALQISRQTPYSRTQVYRHLEHLQALQLASATNFTYGSLYEALPYQQLEGVVVRKQAEVAALQKNLIAMQSLLQTFAQTSDHARAKVLHYTGIDGLKQVNWNLTKADKKYCVFEMTHLSDYLDITFAVRCRERTIERGVHTHDLTNRKFTKLRDIEPHDYGLSEYRYIDPKVLNIQFEVFIYNDLVTLLDYSKPEIFCVEVYHPALKAIQQQLFDAMWQQGTPVKIVS